jgi:hypothetical protein
MARSILSKTMQFISLHIVIDNLNVNKTDLGTLNFEIEGDESLRKFVINSN